VSDAQWQLRVMAPARRQLDRLPTGVAGAVIETLGAIEANPRRLGKPLHFELEGCFSARRGPYRIIYRLDEEARIVSVLAVAHRSDVYRPR
jgi:mRNA interferase RelE/StbE